MICLFYGQLKSSIIDCDTDITISNSYDPICHFNLPIPDIDTMELMKNSDEEIIPDVYDCFELFCEEEELEYKFKFNNRKYNVRKKIDIWTFPSILMITFKRFDIMLRKNNQKIEFPLKDLDLSRYCYGYNSKAPKKFDLIGVCNHTGNLRGGHYYAYTYCNDGNWRNFNDKYVSIINPDSVITNAAYVLFYRAQNI